ELERHVGAETRNRRMRMLRFAQAKVGVIHELNLGHAFPRAHRPNPVADRKAGTGGPSAVYIWQSPQLSMFSLLSGGPPPITCQPKPAQTHAEYRQTAAACRAPRRDRPHRYRDAPSPHGA